MKFFSEVKFAIEGFVIFYLIPPMVGDFVFAPSLITFPDAFLGISLYITYRVLTVVVDTLIKENAKKRKKMLRMAKRLDKMKAKGDWVHFLYK